MVWVVLLGRLRHRRNKRADGLSEAIVQEEAAAAGLPKAGQVRHLGPPLFNTL